MLRFSEPSPLNPVPAKSLTSMFNVTEPPRVTEPPVFSPSPAVIVTASSANLAIGISSLSISATMIAANPSVTASASKVAALIVPLELMFPLAVMCPAEPLVSKLPCIVNSEFGAPVPIPTLSVPPTTLNIFALLLDSTLKSTSALKSLTTTELLEPCTSLIISTSPALKVIWSSVKAIFVSVSPVWTILSAMFIFPPTVKSSVTVISSVDVICSAVIVPPTVRFEVFEPLMLPLAVMFPLADM